ncbi:MAG: RNA 2',3'-cyclic phosphodiesterase [Anaerolineae bacterium]
MTLVRAFIAAELDESLLGKILVIQDALRAAPGGRAVTWVKPEGIHLTFNFLGDTAEERLPGIYQAVERVCKQHRVMSIPVQDLGCFPRINHPRVIWVGLQDDKHQTQYLQKALENELTSLGFSREERAFQPHLTLGRVRNSALAGEVDALGRTIAAQNIGSLGNLTIETVSVIASTLTPNGAVYRILHSAPLQPLA